MQALPITIRTATLDDAQKLMEFNCAIAQETEGKQLDKTLVLSGVRRGLEQAGEVSYLVATQADVQLGCLMLTREWSDWRDGWIAWIQSVYVVPTHRGQGIFRLLLDGATELVQQDPDVVGLRLYVETENTRAQNVYSRTGFTDPSYKVLEKIWGKKSS